ncbi:hypothetical protein MACK_003668 [Theileria orientalis]|uniref:Uncharacterized protein n=1 Tax=Theileria orientalis TaxID=68886 RepID=A0A976SJS2_THEOR|nr:hypothetical protein MACK_003668 [Theileria orientalis]
MTETIPQGENILYLDTSHASNEHHIIDTLILTKEEKGYLYEITKVDKIDTIVYKVDEKVHKFIDFASKVSGKNIEEILVYFIRYNENPLYLSILTEDTHEKTENMYKRINYKLNKNGIWEEASDYALIFTDLNELAHKHDMLQYFEIDEFGNKHCTKSNFPVELS